MSITHVVDASAPLAHFFEEPGAEAVQNLWDFRSLKPGICAVTVTELKARLKEELSN